MVSTGSNAILNATERPVSGTGEESAMAYRIPLLVLGSAMMLGLISVHHTALAGDIEHRTPRVGEMTPAEWRARQMAAVDKSERIMHEAQKMNGLLAQYVRMQTADDADHSRAFQVIFGQYLSWYQTFVGDYSGAADSFSIAQAPQSDDGPSPLSGGYKPESAADVILRLAKSRKAVFFNEAHSAPITRTLTIELLSKLRAEGFNYFAAETLYETDPGLQKRGYPTPKTGFYINEPLYGEMVRTALKLGYKVLPYDVEDAGVGDPRERAGAKNLARIFDKDPKARLVVDAGFAHIQKTGKYLGGSSMAEFFHKISGIDPLCIEQTMMIQHARPDQDHPYYTAVIAADHPARPVVFVRGKDDTWTLKPHEYDMSVVFPAESTAHEEKPVNRPAWLTLGGLRVPYPISSDMCQAKFPCLVQAQYADEGSDAVAADRAVLNVVDPNAPIEQRMVVNHGNAQSNLFLRPGKYRLTATDTSNRQLFAKEIIVTRDGSSKVTQQQQRPRNTSHCNNVSSAMLQPSPDCFRSESDDD